MVERDAWSSRGRGRQSTACELTIRRRWSSGHWRRCACPGPGWALPGGGRRGHRRMAPGGEAPRQRGQPRRRPADPLERGENVRFKVPIDGDGRPRRSCGASGSSCSRACVHSGEPTGQRPRPGAAETPLPTLRFLVTAYHRRDGSVDWQRVAHERVPHESHHLESAWANGSPHHGRRARLRSLRVQRHLCLHARGRSGLEGRPRRHDDAPRLRRGELSGAARRAPW